MTPQRATPPSLTSDAIAAMAAAEFIVDREFIDAGWSMVISLVTAERRSWLVVRGRARGGCDYATTAGSKDECWGIGREDGDGGLRGFERLRFAAISEIGNVSNYYVSVPIT